MREAGGVNDGGWKVPLVEVDVSLLDDDVGVATANTLDAGERKHNLLLAVDICVEKTQNVLERVLFRDNESHGW